MDKFCIATASALLLAGCFTVSETPAPVVTFRNNPAVSTNVVISVQGFATTLTKYTAVNSYQTIFYDGGWASGPFGGYGGSGIATAQSTTFVPQERPSDAFLEQAKNRFEGLGFNIMAQTPDYVVEARFTGPYTSAGDTAATMAWIVFSLLTCDHTAQTWTSRLKIHDNRSGRLVFSREYSQEYKVTGFSPIPLFGISYYDRTGTNYGHCWCLGVLTDRMVADAAEFLTSSKK